MVCFEKLLEKRERFSLRHGLQISFHKCGSQHSRFAPMALDSFPKIVSLCPAQRRALWQGTYGTQDSRLSTSRININTSTGQAKVTSLLPTEPSSNAATRSFPPILHRLTPTHLPQSAFCEIPIGYDSTGYPSSRIPLPTLSISVHLAQQYAIDLDLCDIEC